MSLDAILKIMTDSTLQERSKGRLLAMQLAIDAGCHKTHDENGRPVNSVELLIDAADRIESYFEALIEEEENDE